MKKLKRGLFQGVAIVGVLVAPIVGTITQVYAANEGDSTTASFAAQETTSESFSEESAASSQEASTESIESSSTTESSSTSTSSSETTSSTGTATTETSQTEATQDSSTQSTEETSEEPELGNIDVEPVADKNQYVKIKPVVATDPETQKILYRFEKDQLIEQGTIDELAGKVYRSVKRYQDTDKQTYLEIRDDQKVIGVVAEAAVKVAGGTFKTEKKYATITSAKEPLWQDVFLDKKTSTSSSINGQTFEIKEVFTTNNNVVYYALYSNKNVLIGWIKAAGVKLATTPGGAWQSESKYATIISGNYTLWQNFNWTAKKGTTAALNGKTVKVTGKYRHLNGSTYYSLYTNNNKWLGYINASGVKLTTDAQGAYQSYGKYVTLTKKNYTIWGNFRWSSKKNTTTKLAGKTYLAKGRYNHVNGGVYLSLYDAIGKWIGYLNADAATVANNQGGTWQSEKRTVRLKSKNYTLWQDLAFAKKKGSSADYMNKNIQVTGKYQHFNGSTYYSLYLNNKWLGYINASGVTNAHTITSQSNISRYVVVKNGDGNFFEKADPNSTKLGKKSAYKGYMAQATKLAKTSDGNYLYLVSPAGRIGWGKENQTTNVNSNFWMYTTGGKYPSLNVQNLNIEVSISKQRVYIKSGNKVIYTMLCSTGAFNTPTPLGNFRIQAEKGLAFSGAAYYRSFKDHGVYLFHTIPTSIAWSTNAFSSVEGRKLGTRASHGCIRLAVPDAKWFYYNMPYNTPVKIAN